MNVELELVRVSDLRRQVLEDFGDFARGISGDHTSDYEPPDENAMERILLFLRMFLDSSPHEKRRILSGAPMNIAEQLSDMIRNTLILCSRAESAGWETIVAPKDRPMLYAGIDTQVIENINRDRYSEGIHSTHSPGSISLGEGLN